ncbi:MAG: hypothetical protein ACQEQL_06270 [Pseudomonadota bacterium]
MDHARSRMHLYIGIAFFLSIIYLFFNISPLMKQYTVYQNVNNYQEAFFDLESVKYIGSSEEWIATGTIDGIEETVQLTDFEPKEELSKDNWELEREFEYKDGYKVWYHADLEIVNEDDDSAVRVRPYNSDFQEREKDKLINMLLTILGPVAFLGLLFEFTKTRKR